MPKLAEIKEEEEAKLIKGLGGIRRAAKKSARARLDTINFACICGERRAQSFTSLAPL